MSTFSNLRMSSLLSKKSFQISIIFSFCVFLSIFSLRQKHLLALATDLAILQPSLRDFRQVATSGGNFNRFKCPQISLLVLNYSSLGNNSRLMAKRRQSPSIQYRKKWQYITGSTLFFYMEGQTQQKGVSGKSLKVKVGIFFGYNGEKFLGLQYQRDTANTIENTLHRVLCDNGFVLKTNMDSLRRIKWSRAGRTDKRVHALCNGISASLEFDDRYIIDRERKIIDFEKAAKDINAELPFDIRIFCIKKVGKGFDMRHDAASRIYNYIAPLKLFLSKEDFKENKILNQLEREELVSKLNHLASIYLGTHNFHNFTKGYKQTDPRCDRYIMAMKAELVEDEVITRYLQERFEDEEERKNHRMTFIRFTLVGQSFIYHQIRKMIGLLIKICYEELKGEETIQLAFEKERYDVYLAPGEGLYLNRMTFEGYNKKKITQLQVQLNEEDEVRITKYRNYLQSKILSHEINEKVFTSWLLNHNNNFKEDESEEQKSVNND